MQIGGPSLQGRFVFLLHLEQTNTNKLDPSHLIVVWGKLSSKDCLSSCFFSLRLIARDCNSF